MVWFYMEKPFTGMLRVYIFKTTKPSYRDVVSVYTLNTKAQLPECCEFHEHSLYWHVASVYLLNNRDQLSGWCDLIIIWRNPTYWDDASAYRPVTGMVWVYMKRAHLPGFCVCIYFEYQSLFTGMLWVC